MCLLRMRSIVLLSGFICICLPWLASSQDVPMLTPEFAVLFPGEEVFFTCNTTVVAWGINSIVVLAINDIDGVRIVNDTTLGVSMSANATTFECGISGGAGIIILSNSSTLVLAAAPANITNVIIDLDSVSVDDDNVSFTLSWNEPFANFDPIVNYVVTIFCTNITGCPAEFIVTTTTADVNFITDLSMMTSIQVIANNTIGQSNATTIVIIVPGTVNITDVTCDAVNLINQCNMRWNVHVVMYGDNIVAAPVSYVVSYFGENITRGSVTVNVTRATIDLPAVDSDVNVFVTATNVFGAGGNGKVSMDDIMAASVTEAVATLVTPNQNRTEYSITVTCTVCPESDADICVVMAMADGRMTRSGMAVIDDDRMATATVIIDGLQCEVTYAIIAGGTLNGTLVGPRSSHGNITSGSCPPPMPTPSVATPSMNPTSSSMGPMPTEVSPGIPDDNDDNNTGANTGAIVGGVVGGLVGAILLTLHIILLWFCCIKKRGEKSRKASNVPVAMTNIPLYETVHDPPVSDKVKMEPNPAYQVLTSDQVKMESNPAYQELSSHSGRADVSKQKPAGNVNYYEDIINDQNIPMTENPSYAIP